MQLGSRIAEMTAMPYDEELEYLESNGNQFVNTPYYSSMDNKWELEFQLVVNEYSKAIAGNGNFSGLSWPHSYIYTNGGSYNYWQFGYGSGSGSAMSSRIRDLSNHKLLVDKNKMYLDGTSVATVSSYSSSEEHSPYFLLFNMSKGTLSSIYNGAKVRISRFIGYDVSVDMIPVIKNGDPCMYDKVYGEFYYNQGTGTFGYKKKDGTIVSPT